MASATEKHARPHPWLTLTEGSRAALDLASFGLMRWALEAAPRGDGHPVLVLPGFMADDDSTSLLRDFLKGRGYSVFGWEMGQNTGPNGEGFSERLGGRVEEIVVKTQSKLSIVGQSLGGVYAREIARHGHEAVRQIIMLGSPLAGPGGGTARHVEALYEEMGENAPHPDPQDALADFDPLVPSTSIYSQMDGIVSWQASLQNDHEKAENIHVHASHIGMGVSPAVLYVVADRLAQDPENWRPFSAGRSRSFFNPLDRFVR